MFWLRLPFNRILSEIGLSSLSGMMNPNDSILSAVSTSNSGPAVSARLCFYEVLKSNFIYSFICNNFAFGSTVRLALPQKHQIQIFPPNSDSFDTLT